ncbi:MAG TPA: LuxR C-terminal-related transcriptional regulator [Acidobacteriota bacterium]|nr:LuxR C-terminal-related transcriptional regulator [Acidobacteriota bacterium]
MRALGRLLRWARRPEALQLKSGDAFAECAARFGITARESEIIRLLLEGKGPKEITGTLFISEHTVKNHIHNIYQKLGIRNRIQLVRCFQSALEDTGRYPETAPRPSGGGRRIALPRRVAVSTAVALVVLSAGLIAWRSWGRRTKPAVPPPPPALAVLDFENLSGDGGLERWETGLPLLLTTDLLQSKTIRTLADDAVFGALRKYGLTPGQRYSSADLRRLADELDADYLLTGSLIKAGDRIVITASLQDARAGRSLRTERIELAGEQELMRGADDLARLVKSALNVQTARTPADADLDVEVLTTTSALAYKYYAEARRYHRTGDYEQSLQMLRQAVEIDPEFAMAYRAMASDARNLGYGQKEVEYLRQAFELADRLPAASRERHLIRADYFTTSEATLEQAVAEFRLVLEDHPYDLVANNNLAILSYQLEDYETAVKHADLPVRQGTADPFPHYTKAVSLWALGRRDEALRGLAAYHESHPANRLLYQTQAGILIDAGDHVGAAAVLEKARAIFPDPSWSYWQGVVDYHTQGAAAAREEFRNLLLLDEAPWRLRAYLQMAFVGMAEGRFGDAAEECRRGADLAETIGEAGWASDLRNLLGQALLRAGRFDEALREGRKAAELARSAASGVRLRAALHTLAVECAMAGDPAAAATVEKEFLAAAEASPVRRTARDIDVFVGELELERGRPREAAAALESAVAKLPPGAAPGGSKPLIYFLLGRAREETGDLAGAAKAFEIVTERAGDRLGLGEYLPLAVLGLARVRERLGSADRAVEGYRLFLTLWKDADPGRPEVTEARARLTALSRS